MFFINPILNWQIILLISLIQVTVMLLWGWLLRKFICLKYADSSSLYSLYQYKKYEMRCDYDLSKYPQYALILAKYNSDKTLASETFYSKFGDIVCFNYDRNCKVNSKLLMISSYILIASVIPGSLMLLFLIVMNFVQFIFSTNSEFATDFSKLAMRYFGISLWSTFVSQFCRQILISAY